MEAVAKVTAEINREAKKPTTIINGGYSISDNKVTQFVKEHLHKYNTAPMARAAQLIRKGKTRFAVSLTNKDAIVFYDGMVYVTNGAADDCVYSRAVCCANDIEKLFDKAPILFGDTENYDFAIIEDDKIDVSDIGWEYGNIVIDAYKYAIKNGGYEDDDEWY